VAHSIFVDFLDSADSYEACQKYWGRVIREVEASLGQSGEWQRWISPFYADGKTPMELEDTPIADGRSQRLNRAFRIMQHRPVDVDELEIAAWVKRYEPEYTALPESELVINLSLSDESAETARRLLYKWMTPATTADTMKVFLQNGDEDRTS
jgi:hypothetical protein